MAFRIMPSSEFFEKVPLENIPLILSPTNVDCIQEVHKCKTNISMSKMQRPVECRACLSVIKVSRTSQNIFLPWSAPWSQFGSTIAVDLARLSNVEITDASDYPHMMCQTCCTKLYNACEFIARVQESAEILNNRYKNPVISPKSLTKSPIISNIDGKQVEWPKPIQVEKSVNSEMYRGDYGIEIKQEVLSDAEIPDFAMNSPEEFQTETKKLVSFVAKTYKNKKIKKQVVFVANTQESNAKNGAVKKKINPGKKQVYCNEEYLECPLKGERDSDMELTLDIPLDCLLCSKKLQSVSGLKAHVMSSHNYKSVKRKAATAISTVPPKRPATTKHTCANCRKSFSTPTDLMVHEMCHNMSVCYGCNQKFESFDKLSKHRRRCKAANAQAPRMKTLQDAMRTKHKTPLKCASCDEIFSDEYYMNIHNEIHHNSQAKSDTKHAKEKKTKTPKDRKDAKERQLIEIEILENILEVTCADTKEAAQMDMPKEDIKIKSETITSQQVEKNETSRDCSNVDKTNDSQDIKKKNSNCVSSQLNESAGLIAQVDVSKMSVDIHVENLETRTPQVDQSGVDNIETVDGLQNVQILVHLKKTVVEQNIEDESKMSVDNHDEHLQTQEPLVHKSSVESTVDGLQKHVQEPVQIAVEVVEQNTEDSIDRKVDDVQKLVYDTVAMQEHTLVAITEGHEDNTSVTDVHLQKSEKNQLKNTDNNNEDNLNTVHTEIEDNDYVNSEVQESKNKETNQSTEVDECVNTEVNNLESKENQAEEMITENSTGDGYLNTEVNNLVILKNTEVNDTVKEKINLSEETFPEQTENAEELDISLHNLAENVQSHIHDSDSIQMDNNSLLSDNIDVFEQNSKLIRSVQLMESNNDLQTGIANTGNKLDFFIENNDQEITENNMIAQDKENSEKSIDIDDFIKINVTVESNIEQMETQVDEVKGNANNKTEQEIYPNTDQIKTTDNNTRTVYNIKTLNPEQINLIVSKNFTKIDEIIAPTKMDVELLSSAMEDDG